MDSVQKKCVGERDGIAHNQSILNTWHKSSYTDSVIAPQFILDMIIYPVPWQVLQNGLMEPNCVCFSPTAPSFITGDNMGDLHLWHMANIKVK